MKKIAIIMGSDSDFPDRAKQLFARNEQVANDRYEHLTRLVELYK